VGSATTRLKELCAIVSEAADASISAFYADSYKELVEKIRREEVGMALMPPIPAIDLEDEGIASPLALPCRNESTSYYSALITREGRAKGIAELQGMRVAWVAQESAAGYLVPRMHLASMGLDVKTFFAHETFTHSHLGVVDAVVSGKADVGATFCTLDPTSKRVLNAGWTAADGSKIRDVDVVATPGPIPNEAIVASTKVPASVRSGITRWLLAPDPRARDLLLELFRVHSFRVASGAHYESLRHVMRAARARGHLM
jgi:ABC-type phosphate/phosphonate transport system substrate-binding protein